MTTLATSPSMKKSLLRRLGKMEGLLLSFGGFVVIGLLWEWAVRAGILKEIFVSSPSSIWAAAVHEFSAGLIWGHLRTSAVEFVFGFSIAIVIGILLGLIGGWSKRNYDYVYPWLITAYVTPEIALIPIFILWIGIGIELKIFVIFLTSVFQVALNSLAGARNTEGAFLNVAKGFNANRRMILTTIVIPGMIPFILTGIRQASGRALVGVVIAELIASNEGIGFILSISATTLNSARLMVVVLILAIFGITINWAIGVLERRVEKWRPVALGG